MYYIPGSSKWPPSHHDLFEGWNRDLHVGPHQMITCDFSAGKNHKKQIQHKLQFINHSS